MTKKPHILISEDEKLNFLLLKRFLEKAYKNDIIIDHAVNGKQAVDICDDTVDLVLMDIEMPVMNGFEASKILREKYPSIPIVIQTAHCSQAHKDKADAIGCNAFLAKPIMRKDFEDVLLQFVPKVA